MSDLGDDDVKEIVVSGKTKTQMVTEFHKLISATIGESLNACKRFEGVTWALTDASLRLKTLSSRLLNEFKRGGGTDTRGLRGHLISEELSEFFCALVRGDELDALDALADLLYVVYGSGVSMDLPLDEAFDEVHRSNMTKRRQSSDPDGARVRDKGPDYRPPDLGRVLHEHRARQV